MSKRKELAEKLNAVCDEIRDAGMSVVAAMVEYSPGNADFSTRLSLTAVPELGVSEDHVLLDFIRELSGQWSEVAHGPEEKPKGKTLVEIFTEEAEARQAQLPL